MSYRFRNWLFWVFVAAFVVLTVFISLKASGYRLNLGWPPKFNRLLQKTGMLIIATEPKGAIITLNGHEQKSLASILSWKSDSLVKSPAKIKNLTPGPYEMRLELEGFWPFIKTFTLHDGESVYFDNVTLLPHNQIMRIGNSLPQELVGDSRGNLLLSAENTVFRNGTNDFFDLSGISTSSKVRFANTGQLLIGSKIYETETRNLDADLSGFVGSEPGNPRLYGSDFYYLSTAGLNRFNLKTKESLLINNDEASATRCLDYAFSGNSLAVVVQDQASQKISLKIYGRNSTLANTQKLPDNGDYHFLDKTGPYLQLYDQRSKALYLVDPEANYPLVSALANVKYYAWIDSEQLVYANDLEIYNYNIRSGASKLITRLSQEIKGIAWHPRNYLIYATTGSINLINYENSDASLPLANFDQIHSLQLTPDGKILYFIASSGKDVGLYKLALE